MHSAVLEKIHKPRPPPRVFVNPSPPLLVLLFLLVPQRAFVNREQNHQTRKRHQPRSQRVQPPVPRIVLPPRGERE